MASGSAPGQQVRRVVWSVDLGYPAFHPYDNLTNGFLEAKHAGIRTPAAACVCKASVGRYDYTFDLIAMTQTNDVTGVARHMRRDLVVVLEPPARVRLLSPTIDFASALDLVGDAAPTFAHWDPVYKRHICPNGDEASYSLVPVKHGSPEWRTVVGALGSPLVTVVRVERIQNMQLARALGSRILYLQELLDDDRRRGAPDLRVSTTLAWHGTRDRNSVHLIAAEGLLVQTDGANYYGRGAYTAPACIDTSHPLYTNADPDFVAGSGDIAAAIGPAEVFQVFLVVVITDGKLGDYPVGDSRTLTPPKRKSPAVTRHFGTTNGGTKPTILVTYGEHMTMPQYSVRICNSRDMAAPMPTPVAPVPLVPAPVAAASAPPAPALAAVPAGPAGPAVPAAQVAAVPVAAVPAAPPLAAVPAAPPLAAAPVALARPAPMLKRTADAMLGGASFLPSVGATTTRTTTSTTTSTTTTTSTSTTSAALAAVFVGARVRMILKGYGEHAGTIIDIGRPATSPDAAKCTVAWDDSTTSKVSAFRCAAHLIAALPLAPAAPLTN